MAIDPDIRDQAYEFFVQEAPELLQALEAGLLTLSQEHSVAKVHDLMRAAHSIKGGAASVGLEAIATLAHRLENIFKALYNESLTIDTNFESQLLQVYDCLRLPLTEQIILGHFNDEQALAFADPIFTQIELQLGEVLTQAKSYIPNSTELAVDMVLSIMEVDVAEGLERLAAVLAQPQDHLVEAELQAQIEVFAGFAEFLNLPGFGAVAETVQRALARRPDRLLEITQLALTDFERNRNAILSGNPAQAAGPSRALIALADSPITDVPYQEDISAADSTVIDPPESAVEAAQKPGNSRVRPPAPEDVSSAAAIPPEAENDKSDLIPIDLDLADNSSSLTGAIQPLRSGFDDLPLVQELSAKSQSKPRNPTAGSASGNPNTIPLAPSNQEQGGRLLVNQWNRLTQAACNPLNPETVTIPQSKEPPIESNLTVRVDSERLEQINNLVGELAINRSGLSLQNEQLQGSLKALLDRFTRFHHQVNSLRQLSDQMRAVPEQRRYGRGLAATQNGAGLTQPADDAFDLQSTMSVPAAAEFDPLEMDRYSALDIQLQAILEDMVQLEEAVDDITLFARRSDERLQQQHHMLTQLQDGLVWSRMSPLGEVLNRLPRVLHNLSTTYHKPVSLKLIGTDVLIDKAILEKLYTPLLHLLRNAFDHGVEAADVRRRQGKPEVGQIEIRAYHKGNQTLIEVRDDGQGLNLDQIRRRGLELGWLSAAELALTPPDHLLELIFESGFSTVRQVSKLSGRGVGLDVVRSQLQSIKGTVIVSSTPGKGATFTLSVPLMLTIFNLLIVSTGAVAIALPADDIEEIMTPQAKQIKKWGTQQFLNWRQQIVSIYQLSDLLEYACPLPETLPSKALFTIPSPPNWAPPTLILRQDQQVFALQVDRLITEQELVIKPFGAAIAAPNYAYGCTILGDGSVIPVIDGKALIALKLGQSKAAVRFPDGTQPRSARAHRSLPLSQPPNIAPISQASTVLIVDDAFTLRQTLTLLLEKEGFRVLQARDGRDAIDQLQQGVSVQLVICDIEMPNMSGFEFLGYRRQNPQLAKIPVVMLTSRSSDKHRSLAMRLGASDYLTKPYLEQELLETVESVLN